MKKPVVTKFDMIAPLFVQRYESYLPTAFDESLTILEKMNKIIQYMNEIGALTQDIVNKWNEVMEWILSDGLTESVRLILEEWLENGVFDELINDFIFKSLRQENISPSLLFAFFRSQTDTTIQLYLSADGIRMDQAYDTKVEGRDPCLFYKDGTYYISYTSYNPHDVGVLTSKNLVDWKDNKLSFGFYNAANPRVWAPDFFEDTNGDVYLILSVQVGEAVDVDGNTVPDFRPYKVKFSDLKKLETEAPRLMNLENRNKIDGTVAKHNGLYHLIIKDEIDKKNEHWVSSDFNTWTKESDYIEALGTYTEGVNIVKVRGGYHVYVDAFREGQTYYSFSQDLNYYQPMKPINNKYDHRHGSGIQVLDEKGKKMFTDFYSTTSDAYQIDNKRIMNLNDFSASGVIAELNPIEGNIYAVNNNENLTIQSVVNKNNAKYFYVTMRTASVGSLKILSNGDIETDRFEIDVQYGDNDTLFKFVWVEKLKKFKPITMNLKRYYDKQSIGNKFGRKTVVLTSGTYAPLTVEDGTIYRVNGGNDVIINGVTSLPDGSNIGFMLSSGTNGSITVNSGTNITVASPLAITVGAGNEKVFKFTKVNGSTMRLGG